MYGRVSLNDRGLKIKEKGNSLLTFNHSFLLSLYPRRDTAQPVIATRQELLSSSLGSGRSICTRIWYQSHMFRWRLIKLHSVFAPLHSGIAHALLQGDLLKESALSKQS